VAGLLYEQLILHGYCACVIDPEGDYSALEGLPGVTVLGREDPPPTPRELLRAFRYPAAASSLISRTGRTTRRSTTSAPSCRP
jgi:hypothetical protein